MVEGAAQVVDYVPYENTYPKPPLIWSCCDPKAVGTRFRVTLGPKLDLVSFTLEDGVDYGLEAISMLLRPIKFGASPTEVNGHLHSQRMEPIPLDGSKNQGVPAWLKSGGKSVMKLSTN